MTTTRTCDFPGCDRPHNARGLCSGHDNQRRRGAPLRPLGLKPDEVPCRGPHCPHPGSKGHGLCGTHYKQQYRGKPLTPLRGTVDHGPCTTDGCDDPIRYVKAGLCRRCYVREQSTRRRREQGAQPRRKPGPKPAPKPRKPKSTLPDGWHRKTITKPAPARTQTTSAIMRVEFNVPILSDDILQAAARNVTAMGGSDLLAMLGLDEVAA